MTTEHTRAVYATDQNWDELLAKPGVLLVDFSAEWCPPCRRLEPIIQELATDFAGAATVATVDVEMHPVVTARYKVRNMPTILVFKDGELVNRQIGFAAKPVLTKMLLKQMQETVL
ncbi:thioredoxin family protein [Larkinella sp.]|uniref:thioredoxin family protein n=1 Tax=Larkinella sp. TaxID=2034517 RepID=UPI003BADA75F